MTWLTCFFFFCQCSTNSHFSDTLYVHLWPTCPSLTSTHINSHSCQSPLCFWTVESTHCPLQVRFQRCWMPHIEILPTLPSFPQCCRPASAVRSHAMCSLSSREMQLFAGGTHARTRLNDWHSGDLSGSRPMGCASLLGQSVAACCCVIRLVGGRHVVPGCTRPQNVFTPAKGNYALECLKGTHSTHWNQGNTWDFNLISDWALLVNSQSLINLGQTLCNPLKMWAICLLSGCRAPLS